MRFYFLTQQIWWVVVICMQIECVSLSQSEVFWGTCRQKQPHWKKVMAFCLMYSLHQPDTLPCSSRQVQCSCKHINMRWIWLLLARTPLPAMHNLHLAEWQHMESWTGDKSLSGFIKTQPGQTEHIILSCNTQGDTIWCEGKPFGVCSPEVKFCLFWCH